MQRTYRKEGFTLAELIIVIALLAILFGIFVAVINPAKQFARARNTRRKADINSILTAVKENMVNNNGTFVCSSGPLPTSTPTNIGTSTGSYDLSPCIVPDFLPHIPVDPQFGVFRSDTDYDSQYNIIQDDKGRVTVSAPHAEDGATISETR
ncbi:type II secretion system protein [Candidatus Parcubacteria bacterium]|nr:MAG: type II secretion system protein [Candidatus Parcubacteria bacterium]